jgi:hypothetical protein
MMASFDLIIKAVDQTKSTFANIGAGLTKLKENADKAADATNKLSEKLASTGLIAGLAYAEATRKSIEYAAAINDASSATDVSVQSILALGAAMTTAGGQSSNAADIVNKFAMNLGDARKGAGSMRDALDKVGIGMSDLKNLDNEDTFQKLVQGLGAIPDSALRAKLQTELFGKAAKGLNLREIAGQMKELTAANKENADAIKAAGEASDKFSSAMTRVQVSIVRALQPTIDFFNKMSNKQIDEITGAIVKLAGSLALVASALKGLSIALEIMAAIGVAFTSFGAGLAMISKTLGFLPGGFKIFMETAFVSFAGFFAAFEIWGSKLLRNFGFLMKGLVRMIPFIGQVAAAIWLVNDVIKLAFGTDYLDAFFTKLGSIYDKFKAYLGLGAGDKIGGGRGGQGGATAEELAKYAAENAKKAPVKNDVATAITPLIKQLGDARDSYTELSAAANNSKTPINLASLAFSKAASDANLLGIELQKPTRLIDRDFRMAVEKASEAVRVEGINLSNTKMQTQLFSDELLAAEQASDKVAMRLEMAGLMTAKFYGELLVAQNVLRETELKLADTNYQQGIFNQSLRTSRLTLDQQKTTLGLLNTAYADGRVSLSEYADALGGINARLLTANEIQAQTLSTVNDEIAANGKNATALNELTMQYLAGTLSIEQYALAQDKLKDAYANTPFDVVLNNATKQVKKTDELKSQAERLNVQLKAGTIDWKQYGEAVNTIGTQYFPNYQRNVESAQTVTEMLADTMATTSKTAGDALTTNLTNAIMTGKGLFSSLKDFVNQVLTDIANAIIKKQFVNPIVDSLTGALGGAGGANAGGGIAGLIGGLFKGSQFTPGSSSFVGPMQQGAGSALNLGGSGGGIWDSIKGMFSGMFADGGTIPAGHFGIAGEAGAELITGPATVIPQSKLGGSGDQPIVVNLSLNAIDSKSGVEFLVQNRAVITGVIQQAFNRNAKVGF